MNFPNSKKPTCLLVAAAVLLCSVAFILARDGVWAKDPKKYLGEKGCVSCHKKEYEIWLKSSHARAYERLAADKRDDITCLWCHSTDARDNFRAVTVRSVSCEACHGLGTQYTTGSLTDNFAEYHKARLKKQDESVCLNCHTRGQTPTIGNFDYQAGLERIKHWQSPKQ